jgi:HemY protein
VSPVTGRLDAFVWQAPPDVLVAPELAMSDDVTGDIDDDQKALPVTLPPGIEPAATVAPPPDEPEVPAEPEPQKEALTEAMASGMPPEAANEAVKDRQGARETTDATGSPRRGAVVFPATPPDVPKLEEATPVRRGLFR